MDIPLEGLDIVEGGQRADQGHCRRLRFPFIMWYSSSNESLVGSDLEFTLENRQ